MTRRKVPTPEQQQAARDTEAAQRAIDAAERHMLDVRAARLCVDAPPLIAGGEETRMHTRERIEADGLEKRLEATGLLLAYSRLSADEVRRLVCDTGLPFASDRMVAEWWIHLWLPRLFAPLRQNKGVDALAALTRSAEDLVAGGLMSAHVLPVLHPLEDPLASERAYARKRRAEVQERIWRLSKETP